MRCKLSNDTKMLFDVIFNIGFPNIVKWNRNVIISKKFLSLPTSQIVKMTTFITGSYDFFSKWLPFPHIFWLMQKRHNHDNPTWLKFVTNSSNSLSCGSRQVNRKSWCHFTLFGIKHCLDNDGGSMNKRWLCCSYWKLRVAVMLT